MEKNPISKAQGDKGIHLTMPNKVRKGFKSNLIKHTSSLLKLLPAGQISALKSA